MLMILQKFGQCPLVFTLFGNRSDYELLDVSLKSWKKKNNFLCHFCLTEDQDACPGSLWVLLLNRLTESQGFLEKTF